MFLAGEENMRRVNRIWLGLFFTLLLQFPFPANPSTVFAGETIRINGSGTCLDMIRPITKAYSKKVHDVTFQMEKPLGSSGAIKALLAGALDIAMVSRPLNPREIARGATLRNFGKTPLVIVTQKKVPLKNVSTRELENIYSGALNRWPNGETVRVILRPNEDTDTKILKSLSPGMAEAIARARRRRGVMIAVTDPESNAAVARTIGGIGTAGLTNVHEEKLMLNVLKLNGVMPSRKTLANGSYPLAKEISFVQAGRPSDAAAKFLKFVYSKEGRAIAERTGVLVTVNNP